METPLAIALVLLVLLLGLALFLIILESLNQTFYLYYLSGAVFLLVAASASVALVLNIISGIWLLPGIFFCLIFVMIGTLLWSIASEERIVYRLRKRREPINARDVEKGLDWNKLEKWLSNK